MTKLCNQVDYRVRRTDDKVCAAKGGTVDFLQLLGRAAHQFHTYPSTSPLCTDAVAACHSAFMALELEQPLTIRVGPRELLVDDQPVGRGTVIEHELWRPLHRARVASLEFQPAVSIRDWSQFCPLVAAGIRPSRLSGAFAELLLEAGVSAIVARVTPRPELFEVGAPPEPVQVIVERERTRQSSLPATGTAQHLYPPDKGWVRLDPTVPYESISLVDLTVLVNDPSELAAMLTRLIDEDPGDGSGRAMALEHRYSDVVMLISALDARLGRILFSKLARAVLELDAGRRRALLQGAILPGLLDGRLNAEAVLWEFSDIDLADALGLLLELDAASPHVLSMALDRLRLPDERRTSLAPLIEAKLHARQPSQGGTDRRSAAGLEDVAASLTRVASGVAKDFSEFTAFELALTEQTLAVLADIRAAVGATDACDAQLRCALSLARIEPNPAVVKAILARATPLLTRVLRGDRWDAVLQLMTDLQTTAAALESLRPDVTATIRETLASFCDRDFVRRVARLAVATDGGRLRARAIIAAAGGLFVPAWLDALEEPSDRAHARQLVPAIGDCVFMVAPAIAERLPMLGIDAACAALTVLAAGGAGYEDLISEQTQREEERRGRESMRALARIATPRAAALIVAHIENGPAFVRPAAEEALWRLPAPVALAKTRELLGRREFVMRHPSTAARLLERAVQSADDNLDPLLERLMPLRFHFWRPAVARVGTKAREFRH